MRRYWSIPLSNRFGPQLCGSIEKVSRGVRVDLPMRGISAAASGFVALNIEPEMIVGSDGRGSEHNYDQVLKYMSLVEMNIESAEQNRRRRTSLRYLASLWLAVPLVLAGCSHAPEYSIFGSFFPVWIFCSAGGVVLATGARALIVRTAIAEHLAAPVVFYLSMAVFFACMLWLFFYS